MMRFRVPPKVARVDHRADGYHKFLLKMAAEFFCMVFNAARQDGLLLMALPDENRVMQLVIAQHIVESQPQGRVHRFRFYGKNGFFPEIHLSGKRLTFADHVLQRFSKRVPNHAGEDVSFFLLVVYGCPYISLPVGAARAFVLPYHDSLLAFTYTETAEEYFFTTCLTVNEINSLTPQVPPQALNLHYGSQFTKPVLRHWLPTRQVVDMLNCWEKKIPPSLSRPANDTFRNWKHLAAHLRDGPPRMGFGPGTDVRFLDDIPGPMTVAYKPGQVVPSIDEVEALKHFKPDVDWKEMMSVAEQLVSESPEEHRQRTRR
jgi:hypothetical protein